MEITAAPATASQTIADLIPHAAERYPDRAAIRFKQDGAWRDVTYAELDRIVSEVALGLIDLGIQPGERVCILANTRPEWSYADLAATSVGAVVVPIYQTNSPDECHWVISDSDACAIVCEDAAQLAKVAAIRDTLPHLRTIVTIDVPSQEEQTPEIAALEAIPLEEVRARGRGRSLEELETRRLGVRPEDTFTFIYTSGTTGPPKGCVLTHGNYRAIVDMVEQRASLQSDAGDVVYLYLPLAHSFALLLQLLVFDLGVTLAYFGGDTKQIIGELAEVKPTYLPSVPRIFEKIYTLVSANAEPEELAGAVRVGMRVRELQLAGRPIPDELQEPFEQAEERLFKNVRAAFGGRVREAVSGAAPIAKEILEFFYACGVPVMEGYGMTETATAATACSPEAHRFGSVGRPFPGVEVRIADDGELLIKGPNIFQGYHNRAEETFGAVEDGWLHTGDLGRVDEDGFVYIVGRKKDIIITAGGKNLTPANIENDLKQCRWISQAVMHGDQRPYPVALVTLDEEEIAGYAAEHGLPADMPSLAREPAVQALVQEALDRANAKYAQVEQVKKFAILDHDLSQETGELTPTLKVKRSVVNDMYADVLDGLYAD
ncbi:MAG TPA: AMP-dependent synthetase/ligase [Solirubrobacteraceae bacterium]|jgi:long-chain acyl-CoA synthetase|nr:AMP-dependent synthetase/ligase [Solirubrobacteraceae bacterium]